MTIVDYKEYFEAAAISNKKISHNEPPGHIAFTSIDIEEVINGLRSDLSGMTMFLESPEIRPKDALSDNPRKIFTGAFLIMRPVENGNSADQLAALNETDIICDQMLAKIMNDTRKHKQNPSYPFKIKGFNVGTVNRQKVGPIWGSWYGWRCTFELDQTFPNKLILDQADWNSDTPFSI